MKALQKFIASSLITAALIIITGGWLLNAVVDTKIFTQKLSQLLSADGGNCVAISGVRLAFFPTPRIKVHQLSISAPAPAQRHHHISVTELILRLKLLPLFRGKIEINHIQAQQVELTQRRDSLRPEQRPQIVPSPYALPERERVTHTNKKQRLTTSPLTEKKPRSLSGVDSLQIRGQLKLSTLKIHGFVLRQLKAKLQASNNLCSIQEGSFAIGQGQGQLQLKLVRERSMTNLALQLALQQVRLEELLAFSKGNQWSGRLKLMANFRTQAADLPTMLARLQGQGELELIHGSYQGLDLLAALNRVGLVLKNRAGISVKNPPPITLFDKLTTHFTLQQGILNSQDLTISAPDYTARGHGQLNLNSQLINLTLNASFKQLTQLCLPLTIRLLDHYRHPTIKIDYASLVKHGLQKLTERLSDRKVTDTLQKLFGIK